MKTITIFMAGLFSVMVSAQCFEKVVGGESYYLAISQDGSLWGWGENSNWQLGDGTATDRLLPVLINNGQWQGVTAGVTHSLGIKQDGTLWAWGNDSGGKLGNGPSGNSTSPMQIGSAADWREVHAGAVATIAIKDDGTLWGWGWNVNYFLGNGQPTNYTSQVPVQIGSDSNWHTMSAKGWSCLAIKINGQLWGWGENSLGQLGNGDNVDVQTPIQIGTGNNWQKVTNNERLSFGIKSDHSLWAWGTQTNSNSFLGINGIFAPLQIGFATNWETVSVKPVSFSDYVLLVKTDGTLWGWGSDNFEQLGNGSENTNYTTPTQIGTDTDWTSAISGIGQSFGIKANGTFWTWGNTDLVGDGTTNVAVPTAYNCTSLATPNFDLRTLVVYPNPICDQLLISENYLIKSIRVFDLNGNLLLTGILENTLDTSSLPSGIYLAYIETEAGMVTKKVIKY